MKRWKELMERDLRLKGLILDVAQNRVWGGHTSETVTMFEWEKLWKKIHGIY